MYNISEKNSFYWWAVLFTEYTKLWILLNKYLPWHHFTKILGIKFLEYFDCVKAFKLKKNLKKKKSHCIYFAKWNSTVLMWVPSNDYIQFLRQLLKSKHCYNNPVVDSSVISSEQPLHTRLHRRMCTIPLTSTGLTRMNVHIFTRIGS